MASMRYVRAEFRHDGGAVHPWGATLTAEPTVQRGPMHEMELLEDGTAKVLCRLYGDLDRGFELTRTHDLVVEADATESDPGLLYVRVEMPPVPRQMLAFPRKTKLVLAMPIEFAPDGAAIATFVGDDAAFTASLSDVPDEIGVELVGTGAYDPEPDDLFASLTERQRTILQTAVELGYYESPREATQADVAVAVDLAPGTVGEHLRKIEARTFRRLVR